MTAINLSTRIRFVNDDGTLTPEAYRTLFEMLARQGGALGSVGGDTFVTNNDFAAIEGQQSAGGDIAADVQGAIESQALGETTGQQQTESQLLETTLQPASESQALEMVMQPPSEPLFLDLPNFPTTGAPAYRKGRMYYDTTLNKARIGGATAYETITSA